MGWNVVALKFFSFSFNHTIVYYMSVTGFCCAKMSERINYAGRPAIVNEPCFSQETKCTPVKSLQDMAHSSYNRAPRERCDLLGNLYPHLGFSLDRRRHRSRISHSSSRMIKRYHIDGQPPSFPSIVPCLSFCSYL